LDRTDDFQKIWGSGLIGFISSDQDWTQTEQFHSPFISVVLYPFGLRPVLSIPC